MQQRRSLIHVEASHIMTVNNHTYNGRENVEIQGINVMFRKGYASDSINIIEMIDEKNNEEENVRRIATKHLT